MYLRVNAKVWMSALNANPPPARKYAERVLKYTSASAMASSEYVGNTETVSPSNEIFKWVRNPPFRHQRVSRHSSAAPGFPRTSRLYLHPWTLRSQSGASYFEATWLLQAGKALVVERSS